MSLLVRHDEDRFRDLCKAEVYKKDGGQWAERGKEAGGGNKCCVVVADILRLNLINLPHSQSAQRFEMGAPQKLFQLPLQRGDPQPQQHPPTPPQLYPRYPLSL
jgi:hypothetical protein